MSFSLRPKFIRFLPLCFLCLAASLGAQENLPEPPKMNEYKFWDEFSQMLYYLGMICLGMLVVAWFLKKALHTRMQQMNLTSSIKILEKRSLSPKSSLYLIDVLGKGVLIGETPGGIHLITELPTDIPLPEPAEVKPTRSFAELLKKEEKNEE